MAMVAYWFYGLSSFLLGYGGSHSLNISFFIMFIIFVVGFEISFMVSQF